MAQPSIDAARQCWIAGDLAGVDRECEALLAATPDLAEAWVLRSRVALTQGQRPRAAELLAAGYEATGQPFFAAELATLHIHNRDPEQARHWLDEWETAGAAPDALALKQGMVDWLEGEHETAVEHFRAAWRLDPENPEYATRLARALAGLGRTQDTFDCLDAFPETALGPGGYELLVLSAFDLRGPEAALETVRRALGRHPANPDLNYLHAALRTLSGDPPDTASAMADLALTANRNRERWESFRYAIGNGPNARWHGLTPAVLAQAIEEAPADGLACEFGVYQGLSLRFIAARRPGPVHGFDSFQGLPEAWKEGEGAGSYSARNRLPSVPANVTLHPGWFEETLPAFVSGAPGRIALLHIDCDIYRSTATVLAQVRSLLAPGTVVAFDEYLGYPGYREHEFAAWHEFVAHHGVRYEYIAFNLTARKAALRILGFG